MSVISPAHIEALLTAAADQNASDLHIVVGHQPLFRIEGKLVEVQSEPVVTPESANELVLALLSDQQREKFLRERELDFAYQVNSVARFRVNAHWERGFVGLVARLVKAQPPTMEQIMMPEIVYELTRIHHGLVLVTGPTGCGKSTSLAAMIQLINQERKENIITLEDPIEFLFTPEQSIIRQRELTRDFVSFSEALKHVVRQDPNVIMVGEMRDLETIAAALTVAETGHLVLATLHTNGSAETIDRIIDVFPPHQQHQIRLQLSMELRAVVSQQLLPAANGGRIAAREIMLNTAAVANLIRENKITQLKTVMQTSAKERMTTMDQHIKQLFKDKLLTKETAAAYMENPEMLR